MVSGLYDRTRSTRSYWRIIRGRGGLPDLACAETADCGATATESVAACICSELRRQYAIERYLRERVPPQLLAEFG